MKTRFLLIYFLLSFSISAYCQKIVGYLPSYRNPSPTVIQYSKMTHLIYCFINPNSTGNLVGVNTVNIGDANYDFNMNNFIVAKANCYPIVPSGPKLIISVGGADGGNVRSNNLSNVCGNATFRATLVSQLVSFAIAHNLYGIDIDWEFPTTATAKNNHQSLLADLRAAINASSNPNLKIGIAIGGETVGGTNHTQYINVASLSYVDDFNIMAYDLPSAYDANNHSPLAAMTAMINNWNAFGVPKAKMVLGVPFYGRTPARSSTNGEYNVITAALSGAALTTAFTNDGPTGGFYYNGKTTLEAKIDLIMNTHCGQGVMIWDVGQDRVDAYSLLTVLYNRMTNTTCTLPKPNLGADASMCAGTLTLTASGTPAASGRNFVWARNGTTVATTSANTYAITQGGTWTVTVTESCCKRSDEIIVSEGSTVAATGATRCGTGTVVLNVTSTGSTYDWYDASTGGTYLSTTTAYTTPSISTTTSYYVQQNSGTSLYYTGKTYPATAPQKEYADYSGRAHWANKMVVSQSLTIKSVDVYYSGPAVTGARLVAYSSVDGTSTVYQSTPVNFPAQSTTALAAGFPVTMNTNLTLPPGTYYMAIYAPGADAQGANPGVTLDPNGVVTAYAQAGLFSIDGRAFVNWGGGFNATGSQGANYGQLFNWVITANSTPCGRTLVTATINCPPTITLTSPAPPGPVSAAGGMTMTLTSTASDDGSISTVVYEIRDALNALIATIPGGASPTYSASFTPTAGQQYKIRAVATDNTSLSTSTADVIVNAALPISLLEFNATKQTNTVLLSWATASEIDNAYFTLERSSEGIHYFPIGTIPGAGTSQVITNYQFIDRQPLAGVSYYRLRQTDIDQQSTLSKPVTVSFEATEFLHVYPNPFEETFTIAAVGNTDCRIEVYSSLGVLLCSKTVLSTESSQTLGAELPSGYYTIKAIFATHVETYRLEKVK